MGYPLSFQLRGARVRVTGVEPGGGSNHRLMELGIAAGADLTVVDDTDPMIVILGGSRLALSRHLAHQVIVGE